MINSSGFNQVSIANMALSHIGATSSISDLNENSAEAAQVRVWYDFALLETLQKYNWTFARKKADLVAFTDTPENSDYVYRYHDLTDCVAFRSIYNPAGPSSDAIPFEIEQFEDEKTLLTNQEDAVAIYTRYQTNTSLYSPGFVIALSACLAYHICFPLTGDKDLRDKLFAAFNGLVRQAAAVEGNEKVDPQERDSASIRARN